MTKRLLLVIEDNPLLTGLYQAAFTKQGMEALFAQSGEEGLKLAREKKPQVVALDLLMPGISGLEVLKQLKQDPATKDIKVIIATVMSDERSKQAVLKLGAVDYIVKSDFKLEQVVERMMKHFDS